MRRHALFAACLGAACTGATDSRPSGFTSVAAGFFHTCGVLDGTATCWGQDWMGQLGDGVAGESRGTLAPVDGGLRFVVLRGGFQYTCGLTSSGAAYCWGDRDHGSLGNGNPASGTETRPVRVRGGLTFEDLQVSRWKVCGLTAPGAVHCWGNGDTVPVTVAGAPAFASITVGNYHACGLTAAGAAHCWGWGEYGQLGNGDPAYRTTPVAVSGGHTFASLTAGHAHTCGLTTSGTAHCWGFGAGGALGTGDTLSRGVPTAVGGGLSLTILVAGDHHTCGVTSAGAAWCWGADGVGQLGTGVPPASCGPVRGPCRVSPTPVAGGLGFTSLVASLMHTCGLVAGGEAYCWGSNDDGQLGIGTVGGGSATPVAVMR